MNRYFLKADWQDDWYEVTKEAWIKAERSAGFRPKMSSAHPDYMTTCATGGFSGYGISGEVRYQPSVGDPQI
jgi:hypothetical protein